MQLISMIFGRAKLNLLFPDSSNYQEHLWRLSHKDPKDLENPEKKIIKSIFFVKLKYSSSEIKNSGSNFFREMRNSGSFFFVKSKTIFTCKIQPPDIDSKTLRRPSPGDRGSPAEAKLFSTISSNANGLKGCQDGVQICISL